MFLGRGSTFSQTEINWFDSLSIENNKEVRRRKLGFQTYPFGGNRMKVQFADGKVAFFNYRIQPECINDPECKNSQNPFYNKGKNGPINSGLVYITYTDSLYLLAK